ncbi:MAG TPA: Wzt carbohydrate-binding domain-containing protein, partial [Capillimicrobium sp.]
DRVAARYLELNFNRDELADAAGGEDGAAGGEPEVGRYGDRRAEIVEAWFEDEAGERARTVPNGQRCAICFTARFREPVADPLFGVVLADDRGTPVFEASNVLAPASGRFDAGAETTVRIAFDCVLSSGRYEATPAIAHGGSGVAWIDRRERFASVVVAGARSTDAVLDLPFDLEVGARERR